MLRSLACLLIFTSTLVAQGDIVALRTSDHKFAPGWEVIPAPQLAPQLERTRYPGYTDGIRTPGTFEIAYCLVDENFWLSPVSTPVTINPTTYDWDVVGTTPAIASQWTWRRACGILWVWRQAGTTVWKPFAGDENHIHSWHAGVPFKAITGWHHEVGGHKLYQLGIGWGDLSDTITYPPSSVLTTGPPAPSIRLLECRNYSYDVAISWACNDGETALSPVGTVAKVPGEPSTRHAPFKLLRMLPGGDLQPPQGALGYYFYMRKANSNEWHRQPCPDGLTGYLWALDVVTMPVNQFVESGIRPAQDFGPTIGRSYLSSLHKALRDWAYDVIVDTNFTICCPLISPANGNTWKYEPVNEWVAPYATTTGNGTWTLTIDGLTTPPMPRTNHASYNTVIAQWRVILDATFGAGNVAIGDFWPNYAPKVELTGKWAATNMTGRLMVVVKDQAEAVVPSGIVGSQTGQGWVMRTVTTKYGRRIATSNAGRFYLKDSNTTPDGVTGYPTGWPHWVEMSQRTELVGASMTLAHSNCGIATADNSGGQAFHFQPQRCTVGTIAGSPSVTFGLRCVESSSWGWNGHLCSELIADRLQLQCKFPLVCEGPQAANWQVRDATCHSDGSLDSAILTISNNGAFHLGGRFTCDNVRTLIASVWCKEVTIDKIFIDGGIPCLMNCNANSFTRLTLEGGKLNQWVDWIHAIESPSGAFEFYEQWLITDGPLDSQTNGPVTASLCNPKLNQSRYKPRWPDEVPYIFQSIAPVVVQP